MQPASSHSPSEPRIQYVATDSPAATKMVLRWSRTTLHKDALPAVALGQRRVQLVAAQLALGHAQREAGEPIRQIRTGIERVVNQAARSLEHVPDAEPEPRDAGEDAQADADEGPGR